MYDRYLIFNKWTKEEDAKMLDSLVADIRFTANYFLQNDASMNKLIPSGEFKGQKVLDVIAGCRAAYLGDFFEYIIARPRLYAGRRWKISEIFATWLTGGAPTVIKR